MPNKCKFEPMNRLLLIPLVLFLACEDKQEKDCAGVEGGTAVIDNCDNCVGGNTGVEACTGDCAGEWGGTASVDSCGLCTGGTTGLLPNYLEDCNGDCGGVAELDNCNICFGGNTGLIDCSQELNVIIDSHGWFGTPPSFGMESYIINFDSTVYMDETNDYIFQWKGVTNQEKFIEIQTFINYYQLFNVPCENEINPGGLNGGLSFELTDTTYNVSSNCPVDFIFPDGSSIDNTIGVLYTKVASLINLTSWTHCNTNDYNSICNINYFELMLQECVQTSQSCEDNLNSDLVYCYDYKEGLQEECQSDLDICLSNCMSDSVCIENCDLSNQACNNDVQLDFQDCNEISYEVYEYCIIEIEDACEGEVSLLYDECLMKSVNMCL